ncbi:MAG: MBL fold metallo-hydrolase [Oscillospiraceae bacterium]|nr:MBL fold metallo-hydrolase [Oscillospiraceae bacterium]
MKKKLLVLFLAVVALFSVLVFNVSAAEEAALPEICPYCNKSVTWEPLTEANAEDVAVAGGHRYLAFEGDEAIWSTKSIPKTVCLYMNGKTLISPEGIGRVFTIKGTLNLIGEGTVKGRGFSSTESFGGAINVTGTLNVYGTTVTTTAESGRTAGRGGVVYLSGDASVLNLYSGNIIGGRAANGGTLTVDGVANIYGGTLGGGTATAAGGAVYIRDGGTLNVMGGTIEGGTAKTTGGAIHSHEQANLYISGGTIKGGESTKNGGTLYVNNIKGGEVIMSGGKIEGGYSGNAGGAVYIIGGATFEMTGGKITGGSAKTTGPCVYVPDNAKIILSGSASIEELRFNSYEANRVLVKGKCTGSVLFRGATGQAVDGAIVGVAEEGADLHKASYTVHNTELTLVTEGTDVKMSSVGYIDIMDSHIGYCEACDKQVTWLSYADVDYENATYIYSGHYYVVSDEDVVNWKLKYIVGDDVVCLDLMGKQLVGSSRAFDVTKGVLNIMDSVGGGSVTACGPTNVETVYGGVFFVREPSTLNLYSGKLTYTLPTDGRSYVARGGVVYCRGALNVYGGEISGGAAKAGGNVYIDAAADYVGHMGLYGGLVGANVKVPGASTSGPCIVNRGTQTLSGNGTASALLMSNAKGYTPALAERITIDGAYTGSVAITLSEWDGTIDIGTAVNADVSGCNVTFASNEAKGGKLVIADGQLFVLHNEPAALVRTTAGAYTVYATAAEAVAAAGSENLVILLANAENIAVEGMVHMDLNGFAVNGAAGAGTLVCKDSATDDFTVADGAYGCVTGATCQVAGMTVASPCGEDNYLMVTENGAASFHRVQLTIAEAVFRPAAAGIYYKCSFLGDEKVAALVKNVGIVLNASEAPTLANMETTSLYTQQGAELFGATGTSCLLADVLKADLADAENLARATTDVYANAYITTVNGEVLLGNTVCTNLQEQVNTIDANWTYMTIQQKAAFMDMYYAYQALLAGEGWSVTNAVSIADRKNQFETIDYTPYVCPWNYDVVEAAKADGKVHYYFFAGEGLFISATQTYKDKWGDAYLVVFPNGQTMLVDSGPLSYAPVVAENLRRMGITHLDAILITHPHSDHHNGLFSDSAVLNIGFLQEITVDQVYFRGGVDPDSTTEDLVSRVCRDLNIPCDIMENGDVLTFGDVRLECVWPLLGQGDAFISGGEEINNMSIVVRVDYGEHSSLLTGDLYVQGEKWVLERVDQALLDVDFLKVPHHGYNTSSSVAFLQAITPELAMSIGRLPIPSKVYERYETLGIELLDDRMCGYVEVTGAADGTLEYTTSRDGLEDDNTTPDTGDEEVLPDTDED